MSTSPLSKPYRRISDLRTPALFFNSPDSNELRQKVANVPVDFSNLQLQSPSKPGKFRINDAYQLSMKEIRSATTVGEAQSILVRTMIPGYLANAGYSGGQEGPIASFSAQTMALLEKLPSFNPTFNDKPSGFRAFAMHAVGFAADTDATRADNSQIPSGTLSLDGLTDGGIDAEGNDYAGTDISAGSIMTDRIDTSPEVFDGRHLSKLIAQLPASKQATLTPDIIRQGIIAMQYESRNPPEYKWTPEEVSRFEQDKALAKLQGVYPTGVYVSGKGTIQLGAYGEVSPLPMSKDDPRHFLPQQNLPSGKSEVVSGSKMVGPFGVNIGDYDLIQPPTHSQDIPVRRFALSDARRREAQRKLATSVDFGANRFSSMVRSGEWQDAIQPSVSENPLDVLAIVQLHPVPGPQAQATVSKKPYMYQPRRTEVLPNSTRTYGVFTDAATLSSRPREGFRQLALTANDVREIIQHGTLGGKEVNTELPEWKQISDQAHSIWNTDMAGPSRTALQDAQLHELDAQGAIQQDSFDQFREWPGTLTVQQYNNLKNNGIRRSTTLWASIPGHDLTSPLNQDAFFADTATGGLPYDPIYETRRRPGGTQSTRGQFPMERVIVGYKLRESDVTPDNLRLNSTSGKPPFDTSLEQFVGFGPRNTPVTGTPLSTPEGLQWGRSRVDDPDRELYSRPTDSYDPLTHVMDQQQAMEAYDQIMAGLQAIDPNSPAFEQQALAAQLRSGSLKGTRVRMLRESVSGVKTNDRWWGAGQRLIDKINGVEPKYKESRKVSPTIHLSMTKEYGGNARDGHQLRHNLQRYWGW